MLERINLVYRLVQFWYIECILVSMHTLQLLQYSIQPLLAQSLLKTYYKFKTQVVCICYMWQSRLETQCYVAILVSKTMQVKVFISIQLWALPDVMLDCLQHVVQLKGCLWLLSDNDVTFLDQKRFAQRCHCSGRVLAAYCWTLNLLSMSQMTTKKLHCLLALRFHS